MSYDGLKTIVVSGATVSNVEECRDYQVAVQYLPQFIFQPVTFDMHFDVLDKIPDSEGKILMENKPYLYSLVKLYYIFR